MARVIGFVLPFWRAQIFCVWPCDSLRLFAFIQAPPAHYRLNPSHASTGWNSLTRLNLSSLFSLAHPTTHPPLTSQTRPQQHLSSTALLGASARRRTRVPTVQPPRRRPVPESATRAQSVIAGSKRSAALSSHVMSLRPVPSATGRYHART
jgi:hypothetical protein